MTKKKSKYYVVWSGRNTGVYDTWNECKAQTEGFAGAKYKGFETKEAAEEAYKRDFRDYIDFSKTGKKTANAVKSVIVTDKPSIERELDSNKQWPMLSSLSVDAACSGNPGKMEYRGVYTGTGQEIFRVGPFEEGTNNIGEFLAIIHGLAYLKKTNSKIDVIYSDSKIGQSWIRKKKCMSKLQENAKNTKLFELVKRGEKWLQSNEYSDIEIRKWKTEIWGEIPADFGRK